MRCSACQSEMTLLFTSYVCDRCDGHPAGTFYRGFVLWRASEAATPTRDYVFRTRETAERWRALRNLDDADIREVLSDIEITWHTSKGSITDLELADHVFDIFPDHRFPPGPHRAFLAPVAFDTDEEVVTIE